MGIGNGFTGYGSQQSLQGGSTPTSPPIPPNYARQMPYPQQMQPTQQQGIVGLQQPMGMVQPMQQPNPPPTNLTAPTPQQYFSQGIGSLGAQGPIRQFAEGGKVSWTPKAATNPFANLNLQAYKPEAASVQIPTVQYQQPAPTPAPAPVAKNNFSNPGIQYKVFGKTHYDNSPWARMQYDALAGNEVKPMDYYYGGGGSYSYGSGGR